MLRIVGVQRSQEPKSEFVLLQNQGILKVQLRGHLVVDEHTLMSSGNERQFAFTDDEMIPAGCYVLLLTGEGINGWRLSADGSHVYHVYWNRKAPVWLHDSGTVHLLNVVHTNRPRAEGLLISR